MPNFFKIFILTLTTIGLLWNFQAMANSDFTTKKAAIGTNDAIEASETSESENCELENSELFYQATNNFNIPNFSLTLRPQDDNTALKDLLFLLKSPPNFQS